MLRTMATRSSRSEQTITLALIGMWIASSVFGVDVGATLDSGSFRYPTCNAVVDVTKAPYFAKGDGVADDTDALQRALKDTMGQHKLVYFPNGTYLVSRTLMWSKQNTEGKDAWGKNFICGESVVGTKIRLKDATFADEQKPGSIMWCGGFGSADWFHNYVENITFDVGNRNPAAIGLQFYSNNSGAVRNCRIVAPVGSGLIGLDLGHCDMNGPLLVRNCEVAGFQRGITTAGAVNGQTFENITLRGQAEFGFDNAGQAISIRGLLSENAVPAVRSYGALCLIDSELIGTDDANRWPAIINYNGGRMFVRDIRTAKYGKPIGDVETSDWTQAIRQGNEDEEGTAEPDVTEYSSHPVTTAFQSSTASLRLPIKEPPILPVDKPSEWANVDDFGADPTGQRDSAGAIQRAVDSGKNTIFMPGSYLLEQTVVVRGNARRFVGVGGMIDYFAKAKPDFRIVDGKSPVVSFEHFAYVHGGVEIDTSRTVLFRSVSDCDLTLTYRSRNAELYFEDFVTHDLQLNGQRVWARQLNVENEGTHIVNGGGSLWILGYKTERGGTLIDTRAGGRSEVLGGFSYTTTAGTLAPMFVTRDASVFTFFSEVCFNGDPFATLVHETRGPTTRQLSKEQAHTAPYAGH